MVVHCNTITWPDSAKGGKKPQRYKIELEHQDGDAREVGAPNLDAKVTITKDNNEEELVGYMSGTLLKRPNPYFFEQADAVSAELEEVAAIFCQLNGVASQVQHPKLVEDTFAVHGGGLLHIDTLEVNPSHQGNDLGLRILHEVFTMLRNQWTLAVLMPCCLGRHRCKWKDNARATWPDDRHPTPEELEELETLADKVKWHYARLGFVQAGKRLEEISAWFLTSTMYFSCDHESPSSEAITEWISKDEARQIVIHKKPSTHVVTAPLDSELYQLIVTAGQDGLVTLAKHTLPRGLDEAARDYHAQEVYKQVMIECMERLIRSGASIHESRALFKAIEKYARHPYILETLVRMGGDVNRQDENGNCPIHVAASMRIYTALPYLVETARADTSVTNNDGDTPLHCLERNIADLSDIETQFGSHIAPSQMKVLPLYEATLALMPQAMRASLVEGWMSPRMLKMLSITADMEEVTFHDGDTLGFVRYQPKPLSECCSVFGINRIDYIPASVLTQNCSGGICKSFHDGWSQVWSAMRMILNDGRAPTVHRIEEYIQSGRDLMQHQHFLSKGGRIEFAIDALIDITRNVAVKGDDGWEYHMFQDDVESLSATPLDKAFDVAWFFCISRGGGNLTSSGPYPETYQLSEKVDSEEDMDGDY